MEDIDSARLRLKGPQNLKSKLPGINDLDTKVLIANGLADATVVNPRGGKAELLPHFLISQLFPVY
jgi:hypothetical protein